MFSHFFKGMELQSASSRIIKDQIISVFANREDLFTHIPQTKIEIFSRVEDLASMWGDMASIFSRLEFVPSNPEDAEKIMQRLRAFKELTPEKYQELVSDMQELIKEFELHVAKLIDQHEAPFANKDTNKKLARLENKINQLMPPKEEIPSSTLFKGRRE